MSEVYSKLRQRYSPPKWAYFEEVRNGGGFNATRSCDAIAMSLWPSEGLLLHGHEVKVSRADWLRELKQPAKADEFMAVVDFWWLVAGDREIVKLEELPDKWGMLAPRGDRLVVVKHAIKLTPLPLDRGTLSSLLRRAQESKASEMELKAARDDATERAMLHGNRERERLESRLGDLLKFVSDFETASGIRIHDCWRGGKDLGAAVRIVMESPWGGVANQLRFAAQQMENGARALRESEASLRGIEIPVAEETAA